jgi:Fe-S-cluster containining protein
VRHSQARQGPWVRPRAAAKSAQLDLRSAFRRARRRGLFDTLARIYGELPDVVCEKCARCCFESPGLFFVEFLGALDLLAGMPRGQREQAFGRVLHELFFAWIDPDRACVFLEESRCLIYQQRPLACRLFGLVAPQHRDLAEAEARLAARQNAARLMLLGIRVPEAVMQRSLASCDRVRIVPGQEVPQLPDGDAEPRASAPSRRAGDLRGRRPPRVDGDRYAARVAELDAVLLPREVVLHEFCFFSLPERVGAHCLSKGVVEDLRVQLLRRAQAGEDAQKLLDQVRAMADWRVCLWERPVGAARPGGES